MSTLYFDCFMGAAGDMLTAALLELLPHKEDFLRELNAIGLPHTVVTAESSVKCGIGGTHVTVKVHHTEEGEEHHHCHDHHPHSAMEEISHRISHLRIPEEVRRDVTAVYSLLAEAESRVHGVPVKDIHFHEVGTLDALADITAVCLLIHRLKPTRILSSPIHVGKGTVRCAHGILPVPAPATAELLKGIPIYSGEVTGELCTPTGAALLRYFAEEFVPMPPLRPTAIGYGMGKKDFPLANCVRALWEGEDTLREEILELSCNLDDMTPEDLGFVMELCLKKGALDVYTTPIGMKKSRLGVKLSLLCRAPKREEMVSLLFAHTSTLGIREQSFRRHSLEREILSVDTQYGPVRCKVSRGFGVEKRKYEAEDLKAIAEKTGLSLREIRSQLP